MDHDTIAAISTGMSGGGIGIIRISGKEAFSAPEFYIAQRRQDVFTWGKRLRKEQPDKGNTDAYGGYAWRETD